MTQAKANESDYLLLLTFIDCLERIDILLLEARHLQVNIIHYLREPGLYLPIRFEEKRIWGDGWEEVFNNIKEKALSNPPFNNFVSCWTLSYPTPDDPIEELNHKTERPDDKDNLQAWLHSIIKNAWYKGGLVKFHSN